MPQAVQDPRLGGELLLRLGCDVEVLLDGRQGVESEIGSAVDGTHAALPQEGVDAVAVLKYLADGERH